MKELSYTSHLEDTIAAIATPLGQAGLGIVRISGKQAFPIADKVFVGKVKAAEARSHTVHYGKIVDPRSTETVDEVLLTVMHSPQTYSAEDTVEITCHGGALVMQKVLELVVHMGARLALPGEFTLRAFLNGRIDLAQAEAVADLISARSDSGLKMALRQLEGKLSITVESVRGKIVDLLANLEARIDFPDQDIEPEDKKKILSQMDRIKERLQELISTYEEGKILQDGLNVVIIGKPNVGKSSLLNALLQKDRAIVTPIPGTTRDVVSDYANFDGILVRLVDTAGFRIAGDVIEIEGIKRAEAEIKKGDLILLVMDSSTEISEEEKVLEQKLSQQSYLVVLNKIDLVRADKLSRLENLLAKRDLVKVSCTQLNGLPELKARIASRIVQTRTEADVMISNLRHKEALERARISLQTAQESFEKNWSLEFVALDLKKALDAVGEVIGKTYTDEILNQIFSNFCIGK
jgi:tRNA modification GTPase